MKKYKEGTKFPVCSRNKLIENGWITAKYNLDGLEHGDFPNCCITRSMIDNYNGQILTVSSPSPFPHREDWYLVEENVWSWPVDTFLIITSEVISSVCSDGIHLQGMTPIDGWFICKTCGTNLKEIK